MAKLLKKMTFDKINWVGAIKNFNRLTLDNKKGYLTIIGKEVGAGKFHGVGSVAAPVDPENPPVLPPWVWPYVMVNGRFVIVFIHGPKKKKFPPEIDPKAKDVEDLILSVVNSKDVKFDRFASNGVQHLIVKNANTQLEFMALPE